ncbi:MAG: Gfo/Idh/MocA family oxidoreductase, partial [Promethearchaeota archaeon]
LVAGGEIGIPHIIKITSRDPSPPPIEYIKVSGGLFFDMAIHDWDMARYLSGEEVVEVFAKGAVLIDPEIGAAGDIDTATAILTLESGAMCIIDNSRQAVYGYDQRVEVFGSGGCVTVDNDTPNSARIFTGENTRTDKMHYFFLERYMESYRQEMVAFFDCIRKDMTPPVGGNDGLQAVRVAMAAKKSLDEKRPVKLSEVP